jgi:bleomycin hydrolase
VPRPFVSLRSLGHNFAKSSHSEPSHHYPYPYHYLPPNNTMGSAQSKPVQHVKTESVQQEIVDEKRNEVLLPPSVPRLPRGPVSADGSLSLKNVSKWETAAAASAKTRLARAILSHSNLNSALVRREAFVADLHVFNTELDFKTGPVTDQKSSGRCWLFATTNVLRYEIMKKLNLKEFQLSQVRTPSTVFVFFSPDDAEQ